MAFPVLWTISNGGVILNDLQISTIAIVSLCIIVVLRTFGLI
nr:MAG TPA: hypothetical protein [Microviridae sp.]